MAATIGRFFGNANVFRVGSRYIGMQRQLFLWKQLDVVRSCQPLLRRNLHLRSLPLCACVKETKDYIRMTMEPAQPSYAEVSGEMRFWTKYLSKGCWCSVKISSSDESTILNDFEKYSFEEKFGIISLFVIIKGQICRGLIKVLLKDVAMDFRKYSWDSQSIAQLMLCVYMCGGTEEDIFRNIMTHVVVHVDRYNYMHLLFILKALKVCRHGQLPKFQPSFLRKIWSFPMKLEEELKTQQTDESFKLHTRFMQSLFISCFAHAVSMHELVNVIFSDDLERFCSWLLNSYFKDDKFFSIMEISQVLQLISKFRFYHEPLIERLIWLINNAMEKNLNLRPKDIASTCRLLSTFGVEAAKEKQCFDTLQMYFEQAQSHRQSHVFRPYLVNDQIENKNVIVNITNLMFLEGLALAGRFHYDSLSDALTDKEAEKWLALSNVLPKYDQGKRLLTLQSIVDLDCTDYTGNRISEAMMKALFVATTKNNYIVNGPRNQAFKNRMAYCLGKLLHKNTFHFNAVLPYMCDIVEIHLNGKNRPMLFKPVTYMRPPVQSEHSVARRIAIVKHNPRQTTVNGHRPLRFLTLQVEHLNKLGYEVIEIEVTHHHSTIDGLTERLRSEFENHNIRMRKTRSKRS